LLLSSSSSSSSPPLLSLKVPNCVSLFEIF